MSMLSSKAKYFLGIITCISIIAILLFYGQLATHVSPDVNFILRSEHSVSKPDFQQPHKKIENKHMVHNRVIWSATLHYSENQPTTYWVKTNGCINTIKMNNVKIARRLIERTPCPRKPFSIVFNRAMQPGENNIEVFLYPPRGKDSTFKMTGMLPKQHMWLAYAIAVIIIAWGSIVLLTALYWQHVKPTAVNWEAAVRTNPVKLSRCIVAALLGIAIVGLLTRNEFLTTMSPDMRGFYIKWYHQFQMHGFSAFSKVFYNYTPSYLYLMMLVEWLLPNLKNIYAIKLISITFDYLIAIAAFLMVRGYAPQKQWLALVAFAAILFSPKVIINSSLWGQCDAIYTFWLVACVYFVYVSRPLAAMLCWGIACSFKLQAVFFAPFIFIMIMQRRIPWYMIALVPLCYLALITPAVLQGSNFMRLLMVYPNQFEVFHSLSVTAGNLYIFIDRAHSEMLLPITISIAFAAMAIVCSTALRFQQRWNLPALLLLATLVMLLAGYFLPKMHERYFLPAVIFCTLLAVTRFRFIPAALCLNAVAGFYVFDYTPNPFDLPARTRLEISFILNTLALLQLLGFWAWDLYRERKQGILPP